MADSLNPSVQVKELICVALEVARFAGRRADEWMSPGSGEPSLMGRAARSTLKDRSSRSRTELREVLAELRAAEEKLSKAGSAADAEKHKRKIQTLLKKRNEQSARLPGKALHVALVLQLMAGIRREEQWRCPGRGSRKRELTAMPPACTQPVEHAIRDVGGGRLRVDGLGRGGASGLGCQVLIPACAELYLSI